MFDKMLSKIGIGAAKVDTVLHQVEVMRGDLLTGEIHLRGGKTETKINKLYLELQSNYIIEHDEGSHTQTITLHRLDIEDNIVLAPNEEAIFDFELQVPLESPISFGHTHSWLKTGLDVSFAFDPKDTDAVVILPDPGSQMVLAAAEDLGFHHSHHSGRCLAMHTPYGVPFVQEFELKGSGQLGRVIEELDIVLVANEDLVQVQLELDRRNHGFGGWFADSMDLDETRLRFRVHHDAEFGPHELEGILQQAL